jgi:NADH-quinone oxidoreductase subunit B
VALNLPENVVVSRLDHLANWVRANSLWPMPFGTACCGIELMAAGASRHDIARFGAEVMRFSPRQCDLMIVAGRVVMKMMPVLQRIWLQMPEPKWCIAMGACAASGGVFDTYAVVQGVDRFMPVDVYIPGCPPRPEQILQAVIDLQEKIRRTGTLTGKEFAKRAPPEAPRPLAVELQPSETVMAPGESRAATRLHENQSTTKDTKTAGKSDDV